MINKNFKKWINKKQKLHEKMSTPPLFKEKDVWWMSVGINVGYEEDGKNNNYVRPVLIIKKFNRELFLGLPMSTKIKNNKYYFPVTLHNETVSVLISQLRVFSSKRIWNKLGELDSKDYYLILKTVQSLFILPPFHKKGSRG